MNTANLIPLFITYRWWILVPLSLWESTIVAFVAGMMAATGYFNIYGLLAFFFVRDMLLDLCYYTLGYYGGRSALVRRMLAKIHVHEENLNAIREMWDKRPARTMFVGKLSYGIAQAFIIAAGTVRMSLKKFLTYGALAAITQYGVLLGLGYFFGASNGGSIVSVISNIQYVLFGGVLVLGVYYFFAYRMRVRMIRKDEDIEREATEEEKAKKE